MFYTVFQFVTSRWTHVQRSHIENWVLGTVSKNFASFAFFWQELRIMFFLLIALWQENAAKPIAMHRQICLLSKK